MKCWRYRTVRETTVQRICRVLNLSSCMRTPSYITKSSAEAMKISPCVPASACNVFAGRELLLIAAHLEEIMFCIFCLHFKKVLYVDQYRHYLAGWAVQSGGARKHVDANPEFTVSDCKLSTWPTRRHKCGCSPVWIEKEYCSTRAYTGLDAGCNDCLFHFEQCARSNSSDMIRWYMATLSRVKNWSWASR
jgi:hypothetical protein